MRNESHLGIGFQIWNGPQTWFWFVVNPHQNGGAIGTAASESEAVREACLSIEEISAQQRTASTARRVGDTNAWIIGALKNLERYLAGLNHATA